MRTPAVQREEDKTTAPIGTLQLRGAVAASSWAWGKSQPIFLVGNLMKGLHRKGRGTKSAVVRKMKKGTEKHTTGVHCYCVALLPCCEWGPYSTTSCTNATQKKKYIYFCLKSSIFQQKPEVAITVSRLYKNNQNKQQLFTLFRAQSLFTWLN